MSSGARLRAAEAARTRGARVPLHELEAALLVALGGGPRLLEELAVAVGQPPALVELCLRNLAVRGLAWSRIEGIWRRAPARRPRTFEVEPGAAVWGLKAEDAPELTLAQLALEALEPRLSDARRLLLSASRVRTSFHPVLRRLASEAEELHHQVLRALEAARPKETP